MTALRIGVWFLAVADAAVGVVATVFPRVFYEQVPWVASAPPFSEHLMRDYGAMNLAVALVLAVAAVTRAPLLVRTALGAQTVFAVPHLLFHATHAEHLDPSAATAELLALGAAVLLPTALLAGTRVTVRPGRGRRPLSRGIRRAAGPARLWRSRDEGER